MEQRSNYHCDTGNCSLEFTISYLSSRNICTHTRSRQTATFILRKCLVKYYGLSSPRYLQTVPPQWGGGRLFGASAGFFFTSNSLLISYCRYEELPLATASGGLEPLPTGGQWVRDGNTILTLRAKVLSRSPTTIYAIEQFLTRTGWKSQPDTAGNCSPCSRYML